MAQPPAASLQAERNGGRQPHTGLGSHRVHVFTTGGTIASRASATGGLAPAAGGRELVVQAADAAGVTADVEELMNLGGHSLTVTDLQSIARAIGRVSGDPLVRGVVVTHGTDSLEESAYFAALCLRLNKPVVFTGAMRPADAPDGDGPRNVRDALRFAADQQTRGVGVVVAMDGRVLDARYATKVHSASSDAFNAPRAGEIGEITPRRIVVCSQPRARPHFPLAATARLPRVDIVPMYVGADGLQVQASVAAGAQGIVVDGFGCGNVAPAALHALVEAVRTGVTVLICGRVHGGLAEPIYSAGGGLDAARQGMLFGGDLRAPKARLLLMAALCEAGGDNVRLRERLAAHT